MCLVKYAPDGTVPLGQECWREVAMTLAPALQPMRSIIAWWRDILRALTIVFGTITLTNAGTQRICFVAKYDREGTVIWANSAGGTIGRRLCWELTVDSLGNACVAGYFKSPTITFGTTTLTNAAGVWPIYSRHIR